MEILNEVIRQVDELKRAQQEPKYVVLDINTWSALRSDQAMREYLWYGCEQPEPYSPDKLYGVNVAIVTGHPGIVIKVVV